MSDSLSRLIHASKIERDLHSHVRKSESLDLMTGSPEESADTGRQHMRYPSVQKRKNRIANLVFVSKALIQAFLLKNWIPMTVAVVVSVP